MMRLRLTILFLFTFACSYGQQMNYEEWQRAAVNDIRMQPEHGHAVKTKEQVKADEELIATVVKDQGTRRKGSDHLIALGFNYLYKGDPKTAMSRFNQAYLLDDQNENIYWGFGGFYMMMGDAKEALKQYDKGLLLNPKSATILTDKATIYFVSYRRDPEQNSTKLDEAIELLKTAYHTDPQNQNTLYKLAICFLMKNDCVNAKKYHAECMALGGQPIEAGFTADLNRICNN